MAAAKSMPPRDSKPESHVLAAAAAQESTMEIVKAARAPEQRPEQTSSHSRASSFIENVEAWIGKYLDLADEVLQTPAEPEAERDKKSAA
jgi:hypothetical protein